MFMVLPMRLEKKHCTIVLIVLLLFVCVAGEVRTTWLAANYKTPYAVELRVDMESVRWSGDRVSFNFALSNHVSEGCSDPGTFIINVDTQGEDIRVAHPSRLDVRLGTMRELRLVIAKDRDSAATAAHLIMHVRYAADESIHASYPLTVTPPPDLPF